MQLVAAAITLVMVGLDPAISWDPQVKPGDDGKNGSVS
jgi:hypothetical protein